MANYVNHSPPPISPNTAAPPPISRDVSPLSSFSGPSSNHIDRPLPSDANAINRHNPSLTSNRTIVPQTGESRRPSQTSQVSKSLDDVPLQDRPSTSSVSGKIQKPTAPMVFPDPNQVFDSSLLPPATPNERKSSTIPPSSTSLNNSGSVSSSLPSKIKRKKSSFLGRFIYRKDSSKDSQKKSLSHKSSESSLISVNSILHRPSYVLFSTGRQALHYVGHRDEKERSDKNAEKIDKDKFESRNGSTIDQTNMGSTTSLPVSQPQSQPLAVTDSSSSSKLPDMYQLDTDLEHMAGIVNTSNSIDVTHPPPKPNPVTETKWEAPESWNTIPAVSALSSKDTTQKGSITKKAISPEPNVRYCARIFRDDDTFSTLSCPLDITVSTLSEQIARKLFLESPAGYQLTISVGGLTRVLNPDEQPLVYQNHLLGLMGYSSRERLQDVGRDDLSYLCKFKFCKINIKTISDQEKSLLSKDFSNVNMCHMNLQTIPVLLYPHASKIQFLDVSENPSISIPSDFIQSCYNLIEVKFIHNKVSEFPGNLTLAPNLRFLDVRQNYIRSITDSVRLDRVAHLSFLDLQGNFLTQLPSSFSRLQHLKYLNLSSNMFPEFPSQITLLSNLVDLDISFNKIKTLPDEIGNMESLEKLAISNSFLRRLPESFTKLSTLKELDIRYNLLQNIDLLGSLPQLSVLYASKNSVTALESNFSRLKLFYFDRNPITNVKFKSPHSTLTTLNLFKAQIAALLDSLLDTIPLIEKLVLDRNHITTLPSKIGSLKHLRHLSIVANQLDAVPSEIGLLTSLQRLDLHDNNIMQLPEQIWTLSSLEYLNVASNLLEFFPKNIVHSSMSHSSVSSSETDFVNMLTTFPDSGRRPSTLSISSSYDEYRPKSMAVSSNNNAKSQSPKTVSSTESSFRGASNNTRLTLAQSLRTLILCDNQLNEESFAEISLLTELEVLNISYNEFDEIPFGALRRLTHLTAFYISGNNISSIPGDDLEALTGLNIFVANSNRIHNLPAELGKVPHLTVLDVGSNILKYNIHNWPYDWNWRFNRELQYLNFSGNRRLEVNSANFPNSSYRREVDMSDFSILSDIRILGLMDVTLTAYSAPDQTENCRVRTYGSEIHSYSFGLADSLGNNRNLAITDMVLERFRGKDNEILIGLFDGRNTNTNSGNKVSKLIQETFGGIFADELKQLKSPDENVTDALRRAFLNTNKEIGNTILLPADEIAHTPIGHRSSTAINLNKTDSMTGSCATIIYVQGSKLYVANAGDSMAIMAHTSGEHSVLTTRHDPTTQPELARIRASGGIISSTGKLDEILDVSRAIGFYNLIPHIHASPSILEWDITESDEMIILASKQLWEYVSYQIAVDIARTEKSDLMRAAAKLRDFAIAYGASDKMMVMVLGIGLGNKRNRGGYYGGVVNGNMPGIGGVPGSLVPYGKSLSVSDGIYDQYPNAGSTINNSPSAVSALEEYPSFKKRRDKGKDSELARLGGEVPPPQGQLAIVFTDIKNSTSLWESHQAAMGSAIKHHNGVMRRQIRLNGGYEVKTEGDAFIVSFPTPTSALLWCLTVQQSLMYADWPATILETSDGCEVYDDDGQLMYRGLSVRMGIHWGAPFCETDPITRRMDYFGPMVNKAARVSAVADGGQITLSSDFVAEMKKVEEQYEYITKTGDRSKLLQSVGENENLEKSIEHDLKSLSAIGWEVKELGEFKLKGLENPEYISLVYSKPLLGRFEHHLQSKKKKSQVVSSTYGSLSVEDLPRLRLCVIRMETLCSQIGGCSSMLLHRKEVIEPPPAVAGSLPSGSSDSVNIDSKEADNKHRIPRPSALQQQQLSIPLPNTEFEYGMFLNSMVTRIENALTTLCLRVAMYDLNKTSNGMLENFVTPECEEVSSAPFISKDPLETVPSRAVGGGSVSDLLETTMKALEFVTKQLQLQSRGQPVMVKEEESDPPLPVSTLDVAADLVIKSYENNPSNEFFISPTTSPLTSLSPVERSARISDGACEVENESISGKGEASEQDFSLEPPPTRATPSPASVPLHPKDIAVIPVRPKVDPGAISVVEKTINHGDISGVQSELLLLSPDSKNDQDEQ